MTVNGANCLLNVYMSRAIGQSRWIIVFPKVQYVMIRSSLLPKLNVFEHIRQPFLKGWLHIQDSRNVKGIDCLDSNSVQYSGQHKLEMITEVGE